MPLYLLINFNSASVVKRNVRNKKKIIAPKVSPIKNLKILIGSTVISDTKNWTTKLDPIALNNADMITVNNKNL